MAFCGIVSLLEISCLSVMDSALADRAMVSVWSLSEGSVCVVSLLFHALCC